MQSAFNSEFESAEPAVPVRFEDQSSDSILERVLRAAPAPPSVADSPHPASPNPLPQPLPAKPAELIRHLFGHLPTNTSELVSIRQKLAALIADIDFLLSTQVSAILHHPAFQKLESSCADSTTSGSFAWNTPGIPSQTTTPATSSSKFCLFENPNSSVTLIPLQNSISRPSSAKSMKKNLDPPAANPTDS